MWIVAKDITKVIRSLQCSAVNRCRERLDAAALKARELIGKGESDGEKDTVHGFFIMITQKFFGRRYFAVDKHMAVDF